MSWVLRSASTTLSPCSPCVLSEWCRTIPWRFILLDNLLVPEFVSGDNFLPVLSLADSARRRLIRLGGAKQQADSQRQSLGRAWLFKRSHEVQHVTLCPRRAFRGRFGSRSRAGALSSQARCVHQRPSPHPARDKFEAGIHHRKRSEVSTGGRLRDHRLPDRTSQCAFALSAPGPRNRALSSFKPAAGGFCLGSQRLQASQRSVRPLPGKQASAIIRRSAQGLLP